MKKNKVVTLLGIAGFIVMADNWVVSPILPAIAHDLDIEIARAGLLISAYMIPFGIFQLVFGPLADRYGKKQVITFSMILFTLATGVCALGMGLLDLGIYRGLTGIFAASVMPISLALIGDIFPIQERQGAIGSFMGIAFLGQGLSMAIGGTVAFFVSWRGVFGLYALFSLIPTLALLKTYRQLPSQKNPGAKFLAPYAKLLAHGKSLCTYILVLLEGILIIGSFSYLGAYISEVFHYNYFYIGLIMTAFGLATVVGGKLSGKLAQALGPRVLLSLGLLAAAAGEFVIVYLGGRLGWLVAAVALLGFGFIFTHSTLLTRATEFAQKARGAAMSLVAFCFMGGGGAGTALGGFIIARYHISNLFYVYGIALVAVWLLSFGLIRDRIIAEDETSIEVAE